MAVNRVEDWLEIAWFISYWLATIVMLILVTVHVYKVRSDLCTDERKAVNHRANKPTLTGAYKGMAYLTSFCVFFYLCCTALWSVQNDGHYTVSQCRKNMIGAFWTYFIGRGCMYVIFMLRLDFCYGSSAFGYPKKVIYFMVGLNIVLALAFSSFGIYAINDAATEFTIDQDAIPNPCFAVNKKGNMLILGAIFVSWDMIMNIVSLILFIRPLHQTFKGMEKHQGKSSMSDKMIYIAVKYTILTMVAAVSTFVFIVLLMTDIASWSHAWDMVLNSICIIFMTPYYPDDKYYEPLCKLCIGCCPAQWRKYKSRASKGAARKEADPQTKDTASAFRHADAIVNPQESTAASSRNEMAEMQNDEKQLANTLDTNQDKEKEITPAPPAAENDNQ